MRRKLTLSLLLTAGAFLLKPAPAAAQGPRLGVFMMGAFPQTEFKDANYKDGLGWGGVFMSGNLLGKPSWVGLHVGGGFDFGYFGTRSFNVEFSEPANTKGKIDYQNRAANIDGILRLVGGKGRVQPFVQVFAGTRTFRTSEVIKPELSAEQQQEYESQTISTVNKSNTFAGGIGAGLQIGMGYGFWEVGVDYAFGTRGSYVLLDKIPQDGNEVKYVPALNKSRTDLLIVKFGYNFYLRTRPEKRRPAPVNTYTPAPDTTPQVQPRTETQQEEAEPKREETRTKPKPRPQKSSDDAKPAKKKPATVKPNPPKKVDY